MNTAAFVFKMPERLELAKACGADIVAEIVGLPAVIPEGIQMVRAGGTYLEVGCISMGQTVAIDPSQLLWGNKDIISVNMYDLWILPVALDFLHRNKDRFPLTQVVSHQYPLEKANEAFQQAEWEGKQTATSRGS